jgi:hypothetical protein
MRESLRKSTVFSFASSEQMFGALLGYRCSHQTYQPKLAPVFIQVTWKGIVSVEASADSPLTAFAGFPLRADFGHQTESRLWIWRRAHGALAFLYLSPQL